jgi:hypothetical protein
VRASALIVLLAGGAACGAPADEPVLTDVADPGALPRIFGGVDDTDEPGPGPVVALKVESNDDLALCSGVLVAPNVVLTARHCVAVTLTSAVACDENGRSTNGKHVAGDQRPDAIALYTGASPKLGGAPDAVGKAIIAPKGDELCDSDIALVVLDRSIPDVEPVAVRLSSGVAPGETIRSVGYGQNDKKMPMGTRLRKSGVSVLAMGSAVSASETPLGPHEFEVGRSICEGDSGGPALSEDTGAVVGVVSRGGNCDQDFGHVYTTTKGWGALFDEAFAIAGGAPITESGRPAEPDEEPAPAAPSVTAAAPAAPAAASCTLAARPASGGGAWALLAGCAAVALAARVARRRPDRRVAVAVE